MPLDPETRDAIAEAVAAALAATAAPPPVAELVELTEAQADADVARIEAQADADVARIEAQADADAERIDAERVPEPEPEPIVPELDADDAPPPLPVMPEAEHWFFRDRRRK